MSKIELKPCPFCGSTNIHVARFPNGAEGEVVCLHCNSFAMDSNRWNTRHERTCRFIRSGEDYMATLTCSECGEVYGLYETDADEWHFCPNCGCKVISGDA